MSQVKRLLETNKLQIQQIGKISIIYAKNEELNIEDNVTIENKNGMYFIYENHRDEKVIKRQENQSDRAIIWAVILYKKMYDNLINREIVRNIRRLVNEGDENSVIALFDEFNSEIISLGEEKKNKLCLLKDKDCATVVYNNKSIVKEVSLSRAYVVLYNYCRELQEITHFYDDNKELFEKKGITSEEVIQKYIF